MQPHRPTPPGSPKTTEPPIPAEAVKTEQPLPASTAKATDSAAAFKDVETSLTEAETAFRNAEARLDEAEKQIRQAAEPKQAAEPHAALAAMLKDTEARLAEAEKRATEHHDAWLRAKAETENMRRRAQEDISKASKFAAEKFATAMLPVKDSLETALSIEGQALEKLHEGVELTLKQLVAAFESATLAEENPLGQKFDPNKHQAIGVVESEAEPNTVIHVLQKGYLLHERVIRPAMVMVSKAKT